MNIFKKCILIVVALFVVFCTPLCSFAYSVPNSPLLGTFKIYKSELDFAPNIQTSYTKSGVNSDGTPIWTLHTSGSNVTACSSQINGDSFAGVEFTLSNPSAVDTYGYRMIEFLYNLPSLQNITNNGNDYYFSLTLACVYPYGADGVGSNLVQSCIVYPVYLKQNDPQTTFDTSTGFDIGVTVLPKRVVKTYNGVAYEKDYCDFVGEDLVASFADRIPDNFTLAGFGFLFSFGNGLLENYVPSGTHFYVSEINGYQYQRMNSTNIAIDNMNQELKSAINELPDEIINADFGYTEPDSHVASSGIQHGGGLLNDVGSGLSSSHDLFTSGLNSLKEIYGNIKPVVTSLWETVPAPVIGLVSGAIVFLVLRKVVGR